MGKNKVIIAVVIIFAVNISSGKVVEVGNKCEDNEGKCLTQSQCNKGDMTESPASLNDCQQGKLCCLKSTDLVNNKSAKDDEPRLKENKNKRKLNGKRNKNGERKQKKKEGN